MKKKTQTLVFIDDSGDPGFKFDRGSSEFFVIAAVIFQDGLEAEKTAVGIKEFRRKISFPDNKDIYKSIIKKHIEDEWKFK